MSNNILNYYDPAKTGHSGTPNINAPQNSPDHTKALSGNCHNQQMQANAATQQRGAEGK